MKNCHLLKVLTGCWLVGLVSASGYAGPTSAPAAVPSPASAATGQKTTGKTPAPTSGAAPAITTNSGPVGQLLKKWAAEGTAAGNVDDWYDNRDRGHSMLNLQPYPQLRLHTYSDQQKQVRADWALAVQVLPKVVFGNSSTSAGAFRGGSNPLMCYTQPDGLQLLYDQYRGNNLYMYPAHYDFKPATEKEPGLGDLYPTNTPYVIISKGSSGSDQPFMQAVAYTLAAFRPEVKTKLIDNGFLMPTLQMIFRMSNQQVKKPEDYLTGAAHPSVFDGKQVDPLKMAELAHQIDAAHLPPLVQLKVVEEDQPQVLRDYTDPLKSDHLGDTPAVIARVFRTTQQKRRLVVSAESSKDLNKLPLTYRWVLLNGDPAKVQITPRSANGAVAEIVFTYHERAPLGAGADLTTNRVDIGVFAHNGTYWSAPGFVTSYTLDNEARTYDGRGRILEVGYNMGAPAVSVTNWPALLEALSAKEPTWGAKLLTGGLSEGQREMLRKIGEKYKEATAKSDEAEKKRKAADEAAKKGSGEQKKELDAAAKAATAEATAALKARDDLLAVQQGGLPQAIKPMVESTLQTLMENPSFYPDHGAELGSLPASQAARKRLAGYGIGAEKFDKVLELTPLLSGDKPASERLSAYQKAQLKRFNSELLAAVVPGLYASYRVNPVDFRLTLPKNWRDVYRYAPDGTRLGWTRYDGTGATDFNADGTLAEKRDDKGRCTVSRTLKYERHTPANYNPAQGPDSTPLSFGPGPQTIRYEYAGDQDFVGHIVAASGPDSQPAGK